MLHAPEIDPVLLHIWGPIQIRWYSALYLGGFFAGRAMGMKLSREGRIRLTTTQVDDCIVYLLAGTVFGARLFYCLFYDLPSFLSDPTYFFRVYNGGLSFHGGLAGIAFGAWWFARSRKIPLLNLWDAIALCGSPGLAMGRLGNFLNGELWGRVTNVPWGMVFPRAGAAPRHPSQLYELVLEGLVPTVVLWASRKRLRKDGQLTLVFLLLYPVGRFFVEFFREPDAQLGYLTLGLTMGQWLCVAMAVLSIAGAYAVRKFSKPVPAVKKPRQKKPDSPKAKAA